MAVLTIDGRMVSLQVTTQELHLRTCRKTYRSFGSGQHGLLVELLQLLLTNTIKASIPEETKHMVFAQTDAINSKRRN